MTTIGQTLRGMATVSRITRVSFPNFTHSPVAVDLFAGAGGLTEGLLKAGIHVAASVELHPQPALTSAYNHPDTNVLVGDIRDLDLDVLDEAVSTSTGKTQVDLVVGGPPCQGFSSAGKKSSTDPRNSLFRHFVRVIEHCSPSMFLIENVPGFKSMYGGGVYQEALDSFEGLGYRTTDAVVIAANYGVPQTRKRFAMVGWRNTDRPFSWADATHSENPNESLFGDIANHVVAGDALADLAFLDPGFQATRYAGSCASPFAASRRNGNELLFNHLASRHRSKIVEMFGRIPEGGSIRSLEPEHRTAKMTMVRLDRERLSNTIVSLPDDLLHYHHHRILSVRECARLQTFDDDFVFFGKRTSGFVERRVDVPQYTQVGNAVPPELGAALGRALVACFGTNESDLRDIERRRARQSIVCGASGYTGYTLAPEAAKEIALRTVTGIDIGLPIAESDTPVHLQAPIEDWTLARNPRRGQWAPGVSAKDRPNWVTDDADVAGFSNRRRRAAATGHL